MSMEELVLRVFGRLPKTTAEASEFFRLLL